jgi:hypothetical protein
MSLILGSAMASTTSAVLSVEQSSTTTTSKSGIVCRSTLEMHSTTYCGMLNTGMTTLAFTRWLSYEKS